MIKIAISFALGCILFLQLSEQPPITWLWLSIPACILLRFKVSRHFSLIILGGLWTLFHSNLVLDNRLSTEIEGQNITISGIISSVPERHPHRLRFEFSPDVTPNYSLPHKIRLNWYQPLPAHLKAGERWQLTMKLKQARGMANMGAFDYESWLFQQGIGATGYVRSNPDNKRLSPAPYTSINFLRQTLTEKIESTLANSPNIGLIQGLTTGIRHNIRSEQWQTLRHSGTSHLLAISGLHIGLAAAIGFFIFRFLWVLRTHNLFLFTANEIGAIGGFLFALFYAALAGFSIPTQRALIMVAIGMIALMIRRPIISSHVLALSLLCVLLFDSLSILSPGFWLSFSAVGLILFVSQYRFPLPTWQWMKIHIFIAIGLSPLLLLFFMQTSLIAPIANIVAIPFVSFLLIPLLLLASVLLWIWPPIGNALIHLADNLVNILFIFLDAITSLSFSYWQSPPLPFYYWVSIIIGTLLLLSPRGFPAKWLGVFGLLPLLFWSPTKPNEGEFWFTLLDVGQGLSAVIQTKNHTLVFDTGPKFSESFNTGTAIVKPFLYHQGIQNIDTLIISHGDNDHIGGAHSLINEIKTVTILSSTPHLLPNAKPCHSGMSWQWDNVTFSLLHPDINDTASDNDLSCVLKVSNSYGSVLLTGDIEAKAERLLIQRYSADLHATVLVVPHHGSKTSSSADFIKIVAPDIAVFPVGYRNRYHFPIPEIVQRYHSQNIALLSSAEHGAISIKFDSNSPLKPSTWRQSHRKIWTAN